MADTSDLKHMVMSFRVSELQVLLGFAGRNKSGRKQELMQRGLQLVDKGCSTAIHIKIRDLYRRRFPPKSGVSPSKSPAQSTAASNLGLGYGPYSNTSVPYGKMFTRSSNSSTSSVSGSAPTLDYSSKHTISSPSPSTSPINQVPVHPDVRFKRLPFYDMLGELLKPSSLVPRSQSRFQETFFIFHLTPQQAQDIAMSRDAQIDGRVDYTVQIQLRFCLLETSCEQEDNFPPSICVRVNGKMAPLPNPIPTNKPGVEPKRPSRSVNITTICRISPTVPNHINISWASELGRSYCVAVYLVKRLTSDNLLQRLKLNGIRHPDHTRALIKEKLAVDPDSEIVTSSLRISLLCPLGKMRMSIPTRASTCCHLQCFDAPMFLQMNEKKPTWTCPVCDKNAEFGKLFIDGLFTEILRSESDCNEIKFTEDGKWHPMRDKEIESLSPSPDIQSIEDSPNPKRQDGSGQQSGSQQGDVIDLTETDDEEDDDEPVAMSVNDSNSSIGSPSSVQSYSPLPEKIECKTPPSAMSSCSMTSVCSSKLGRMSPSVISLDTPPRVSISPLSLPRSPRRTPLSNPRYSPYSSPLLSPNSPSTSHYGMPSGLHSSRTGPTPTPPPAHSHPPVSASLGLGGMLNPPLGLPYYPTSLTASHLEQFSDTDLDDLLGPYSWSNPYSRTSLNSPLFNPYALAAGPMTLSSQHLSDSSDTNTKDSYLSYAHAKVSSIAAASSAASRATATPPTASSPDSVHSP